MNRHINKTAWKKIKKDFQKANESIYMQHNDTVVYVTTTYRKRLNEKTSKEDAIV
jgi:hypothetical protein